LPFFSNASVRYSFSHRPCKLCHDSRTQETEDVQLVVFRQSYRRNRWRQCANGPNLPQPSIASPLGFQKFVRSSRSLPPSFSESCHLFNSPNPSLSSQSPLDTNTTALNNITATPQAVRPSSCPPIALRPNSTLPYITRLPWFLSTGFQHPVCTEPSQHMYSTGLELA
jgi:hypothetical protein